MTTDERLTLTVLWFVALIVWTSGVWSCADHYKGPACMIWPWYVGALVGERLAMEN